MTESRPGVHPVLLVGLLSLAVSTFVEWLVWPGFPVDLLRGFLDGLALVTIFGYLLVLRPRGLRRS